MTSGAARSESNIREAMRWLLLPIPADGEQGAVKAAGATLQKLEISPEDAAIWMELEIGSWKKEDEPSAGLKKVVAAYIGAANDEVSAKLAKNYFALHKRLAVEPSFDHETASALLSHSRLIALLGAEEKLTSAQVAKLVRTRDKRVPAGWQQVELVMKKMGVAPDLSLEQVERTYAIDEGQEIGFFADADEETCLEMVSSAADALGFGGDMRRHLQTLLPTSGDMTPFGPYLQILHFQCVIAEHYDHALSSIYEFSPRGKTTNWLLSRYPSTLEVKGNAFLNNAKGVDALDANWAAGRKPGQRVRANALESLISGLDSMGFAARRELAAWLRRLLVRRIRLATGLEVHLPNALSQGQVHSLLAAVQVKGTLTRGIVEQRVVDAVSVLMHPEPTWVHRGLLDSVNATNVSKRKCGDCDFQDTSSRKVVAYEAHGGKLTDVYVLGHIRTLESVLELRVQEWEENVGPGAPWEVIVRFVAHEDATTNLPKVDIHGVRVHVDVISYEGLVAEIDSPKPELVASVNEYVRDPIAEARTPDSVRLAFLDLLRG